MNHKKVILIVIAVIIAGFCFPSAHFDMNDHIRPYVGYCLLVSYIVAAISVLYKPISQDRSLRKHFLIRFGTLMLSFLIIVIPYLTVLNNHGRLGAGYLLVFLKRKTDKAVINLFLVLGVYSFVLFSGFWGF